MKLTDQAVNKILGGEGIYRTKCQAYLDLKIVFRSIRKNRAIVDVYGIEGDSGVPVFIVQENIHVEEGSSIIIESPDGLMTIPMELE
jgi:hypothetical protein